MPEELVKEFGGTYLMPSMALNTHFFGATLTVTGDSADGKRHRAVMKDLRFDGENFISDKGDKYFFRTHGEGEDFNTAPYAPGFNSVYRIEKELKELPAVPEGRRIVVLNEDMYACYDSQLKGEYKPQSDGYIMLI